jgi:hypothetical protein
MNDTQTYIVAGLAILVVILIAYNFGLSSSQYTTPSTTTVLVEPEPWIWWNPTTWYPWWWYGSGSSGSYYRPSYPHHRPNYEHDHPHDRPQPPRLPRPPQQQPHLPQIPNMGPSLKPISVPSIQTIQSSSSGPSVSHSSVQPSGSSVPSGSSMTMGSQTSGKENFANYNYPINNIEGFSSGCNSRPQNPFLFESIAMEHALPTSQSITPSAHALKISQPNLPNAYISNSNYHLL